MAAVEHLVVTGLMGCGKTSVGELIAERLGWPLDDSDATIERTCGQTVRELNERLGAARMHEFEVAHLLAALRRPGRRVVAAAASVIENPGCRDALERAGVVAVWLDVALLELIRRFSEHQHRPQLAADVQTMFERQLAERTPLYERVCEIRVVECGRTPEQAADEILAQLPVSAH